MNKIKLESCPGCGSYEIVKDHYHCSYCGNNFQEQVKTGYKFKPNQKQIDRLRSMRASHLAQTGRIVEYEAQSPIQRSNPFATLISIGSVIGLGLMNDKKT